MIDAYYDYRFGNLEYRSLRFESELWIPTIYREWLSSIIPTGKLRLRESSSINILNSEHSQRLSLPGNIPEDWKMGMEPYYPVNDEKNQELYGKYAGLCDR